MGGGVLMFFIIEHRTFLKVKRRGTLWLVWQSGWSILQVVFCGRVLQEENIFDSRNGLGNLMVGFPDEAFAELANQDPGPEWICFCF